MEYIMNMFQCVVCSEQVSRPKSFAYKEGRACRTHEEVTQSAEAKMKAQEQARITAATPKKNSFHRDTSVSIISMRCFCCKDEVVRRDVFSVGMLKAIAKARSKGENENWLTDADSPVKSYLREELGVGATVEKIADVYDVSDFSDKKIVALAKGNRDTLSVMKFTNAALLCEPCAKNFGLQRDTPTVKELCAFVPVSEMIISDLAKQV